MRAGVERRWRLAAAAAPGLLAGGQVAALLWFLNPDIPLDPAHVLGTVGVFAGGLGLVALFLSSPLWMQKESRLVYRALPWAVSGVLAGMSGLYAFHASYFAFYLPGGINVRLLKASFWLGLGALVGVVTALVHSWSRRAYGPRSRVAIWFLALASLFVVFERREAYRPRPEPTPASAVGSPRPLFLLVVGVQGAAPEGILPLAEQGQLPFFDRMLREGVFARMRPLVPDREAAAWTTLATGKFPYRHGIKGDRFHGPGTWPPRHRLDLLPVGLGFRAWAPLGPSRRPTAEDRRARSLWEVLPRLERTSAVVGWPQVLPTDASLAFAFDDRFFQDEDEDWASPPSVAATGSLFRLEAHEIDTARTERFPTASRDWVVDSLRQDLWRSSLALTLVERVDGPLALFLRLPGLEPVSSRTFDGYSAQVLEGRSGVEIEAAADTLVAYYQVLDEILARLWAKAEDMPRLLIVVSPRGNGPGGRWQGPVEMLSMVGRDPESDGLFLAMGEGIRGGGFLHEIGSEDVVATLLYGLGLPQARDLDGQVITDVFEPTLVARHPVAFVPSYDTLSASR